MATVKGCLSNIDRSHFCIHLLDKIYSTFIHVTWKIASCGSREYKSGLFITRTSDGLYEYQYDMICICHSYVNTKCSRRSEKIFLVGKFERNASYLNLRYAIICINSIVERMCDNYYTIHPLFGNSNQDTTETLSKKHYTFMLFVSAFE